MIRAVIPNGESNAGTQRQSTDPSGATSAGVWQFDRNAHRAIGGNGDGTAALRGCVSIFAAAIAYVIMAAPSSGGLAIM